MDATTSLLPATALRTLHEQRRLELVRAHAAATEFDDAFRRGAAAGLAALGARLHDAGARAAGTLRRPSAARTAVRPALARVSATAAPARRGVLPDAASSVRGLAADGECCTA